MKKICFLIMIIFLIPTAVKAKDFEANIKTFGSTGTEFFYDIKPTNDSGYVTVGTTSSNNIDGLINKGNFDAMIVKYNQDGDIEWKKNYGGNSSDSFSSVFVTSDNGYIALGYSQSSDIEGLNINYIEAIIVKYDENGDIEWQKNYGGTNDDYFSDCIEVEDGYIVVGTSYSKDIEGIGGDGSGHGIIVKYDKSGNVIWHKSCNGNNSANDGFNSITLTNEGNYVVVGSTMSKSIGDIVSNGRTDGLIVIYDTEGNVVKYWLYGGTRGEGFYDVATCKDGGYVVVGYVSSENIEGIETFGRVDSLIVKYDKNHNIEWQKTFGGSDQDYFKTITITNEGNYVAAGHSLSPNIGELTNLGANDGIVVEYDINGELVLAKNYTGDKNEFLTSAVITKDNKIVLVGNISTDSTDALIIELSYKYTAIKKEDISTYEVSVDGNLGRLTLSPQKGYKMKNIIITDTKGKTVDYYSLDGNYYFKLADDVIVEVIFEENIANPNTNSDIINLIILFIILIIVVSSILVINKKKNNINNLV